MKPIQTFTFIIFLFLGVFPLFSQKGILQERIYFESAKSDLSKASKSTLNSLVDSLKTYASYTIVIRGNTDNAGDSTYNRKLSEQRVGAVQEYFVSQGISSSAFKTKAEGEFNPIADNQTAEGKQKNRRVDITVTFKRKVVEPVKEPELQSIRDLYKLLEKKPQQFCINPLKDTILVGEEGTILNIRANTFKMPNSCKSGCVTIKLKEEFSRSDMFAENLSTMSNDRILESQGMIYTEASDCNGKKIEIAKDQNITILMPAEYINPNMKVFDGARDPHTDEINWILSNNPRLSSLSFSDIVNCRDWLSVRTLKNAYEFECKKCGIFCKIGRIDDHFKGKRDEVIRKKNTEFRNCQKQLSNERKVAKTIHAKIPKKTVLRNPLPEKTDSSYRKDCIVLTTALEQYNVELDKMLKAIEESAKKKKNIDFEDLKFYVFNASKMAWKNMDAFANIPEDQKITVRIDLESAINTDCKIVFKDRMFIIPADIGSNGKFQKSGVPVGQRAWIVAVKYVDSQPYLSMEEIVSSPGEIYPVNFKPVTIEQLKAELKKLDRKTD